MERPGPGGTPARIPEPSWRSDRVRADARAPLTRESIIEAGLKVLDREGMDGLSMRRVGQELGTGAASLYWHVRNKEELLQLLFERISRETILPEPDPSRWQEQAKEVAREARRVLTSHRDAARISLGRIPSGPTLAQFSEWLFRLLRPVGIPDQVIAYVGDMVALYAGAFAFEESIGLASPTGEDLPPEQIIEMFRGYILSLPEDRFPNTRSAVDVLMNSDMEGRFEFGIDLIVRGLESYVTRT